MRGDAELRTALDAAMDIELPGEFETAWKDISSWPGHSLRIVDRNPTYNCHAYALMIERLPRFQELFVERGSKVLVMSAFIEKLIADGEIRIVPGQEFSPEHIVIYFDASGRPTHTARVRKANDVLVSKWGGSELFEHGLWEVPASYGDAYKVAIAPDQQRAMALLEEWLPQIA
jgi:hypothetical protein